LKGSVTFLVSKWSRHICVGDWSIDQHVLTDTGADSAGSKTARTWI